MTAVDDRASAGSGTSPEPDEPEEGAQSRPKVARYIALAVGVVLVLFIALLATRPAATDESPANAIVGKRVPALSGATLDGGPVDVDKFRGKWVLVNFVAEWCTACKVEHPDLLAFQKAHENEVQVIGVAYGSNSPDKLREFFKENGGTWPVITSDDGRAAIDFGVTAVPETFVVAPWQTVVAHAEGVNLQWLEDVLAQGKALEAQAQAPTTPTSAGSR